MNTIIASKPQSGADDSDQEPPPGWRDRKLSPARGLIFLIAAVIVLTHGDFFWGLLSHAVVLVLEVAEEILDLALEHLGFEAGPAQMVTAYLGLAVLLLLLPIIWRRVIRWPGQLRDLLRDYRDMYAHVLKNLWASGCLELAAWWATLDWLERVYAVVGGLVLIIPLFVAMALGLGYLVSLLLF